MKTNLKKRSQRILTIALTLLASHVLLANSSTPASGHYKKLAPAGTTNKHSLADLPPDACMAITDALKRKGVYAPEAFTEQAKLTASDGQASDAFGVSVAIAGDTVAVGAKYHKIGRNAAQGLAYIFVKPAGGWSNGVESAELLASDGAKNDQFGFSVAISGDTVVVGAIFDAVGSKSAQGSAYVFVKPAAGWAGSITESAKLVASDGAKDDYFGASVATKGETVLVGAYSDDIGSDPNQYNQGSAYVFVKPAGGWSGSLTESAKLIASDGVLYDQLGQSIALDGDTVVIGAPMRGSSTATIGGTAYVFVKPPAGWSGLQTENAQLFASDAVYNSYFSIAVGVAGDTVVATRLAAPNSSAAYVFVKPPAGWSGSLTENAQLTASDGAPDTAFRSVAIGGDKIVACNPYDDIGGNFTQGSAYIFVKPAGGWVDGVETAKLTASDGGSNDAFGWSVALEGKTIVVGAFQDTIGNNFYQGSAYVFEDDSPTVSYVINYLYRFASGNRESGTNTLFADGTFQDSAGSGGTWALTQTGQLTLQYQGAPCNARLTGRFRTPTTLSGTLRCTDGSGDKGNWTGSLLQQ